MYVCVYAYMNRMFYSSNKTIDSGSSFYKCSAEWYGSRNTDKRARQLNRGKARRQITEYSRYFIRRRRNNLFSPTVVLSARFSNSCNFT